jgi:protein O-GlcNAc transferase
MALGPDEALRLGLRHHQAGEHAKAEALYRQVLDGHPGDFNATHLLGVLLAERGDFDGAVELLERAVQLNPGYADARSNLAGACRDRGALLRGQGRLAEAADSLGRALSLKPDFAEAHQELGNVMTALGEWRQALVHFRTAQSLRPERAEAPWAAAMAEIPAVYANAEEPGERRAAFTRALAQLDLWLRTQPPPEAFRAVAVHQPFYLAYQEEPNRDLLVRYGRLCADLMAPWQKAAGLAPRSATRRARTRVGVVSAHLYDHSVWGALIRGWVARLDRKKFELHLFHLGTRRDAETQFAQSRAAGFTDGKRRFEEWAGLIHAAQLDVVIYPEIGMDATTAKLASLRLAPVQAASWGHPETTGLPTMDYYLSAEDLEPADAAGHYSEKLVLLPHLGCWLPRRRVQAQPGAAPAGGGPLLVCPGTPFKYAPAQDRVLTEIARRLGRCRFVFFAGQPPQLAAQLERRLRDSFGRAGLSYERHVSFLPWQSLERFHGVLVEADLYLDSVGFSGFNTALQAVQCGLPVVAREGRFMRGRLASGILRRMGIAELVAPSDDDYIELVVALVRDTARREALRNRIVEARAGLFEDEAPIAGLQQFLSRE